MAFHPKAVITKLKATGHRITKPRKAILEAIAKLGTQPFSVETILELIRKDSKESCDFTSVYRNLMTLEELKIICRSDITGNSALYQIVQDTHTHGHHIVCRKCKKMQPIDFCVVMGQENLLLKLGYRDISHRLEFFGICPVCAGNLRKIQKK